MSTSNDVQWAKHRAAIESWLRANPGRTITEAVEGAGSHSPTVKRIARQIGYLFRTPARTPDKELRAADYFRAYPDATIRSAAKVLGLNEITVRRGKAHVKREHPDAAADAAAAAHIKSLPLVERGAAVIAWLREHSVPITTAAMRLGVSYATVVLAATKAGITMPHTQIRGVCGGCGANTLPLHALCPRCRQRSERNGLCSCGIPLWVAKPCPCGAQRPTVACFRCGEIAAVTAHRLCPDCSGKAARKGRHREAARLSVHKRYHGLATATAATPPSPGCPRCGDPHTLTECPVRKDSKPRRPYTLPKKDRRTINRCSRCRSLGHYAKTCTVYVPPPDMERIMTLEPDPTV